MDVDNNNDVFENCLEFVLPRMMCLLDNNNFQTARYFKPFLHDDVFGDGFGEDRLFLDWRRFAEYWNMHLQHMQMHVEVDDFIFSLCFSWNLQQTLENNVHVCTYLVQACCTEE